LLWGVRGKEKGGGHCTRPTQHKREKGNAKLLMGGKIRAGGGALCGGNHPRGRGFSKSRGGTPECPKPKRCKFPGKSDARLAMEKTGDQRFAKRKKVTGGGGKDKNKNKNQTAFALGCWSKGAQKRKIIGDDGELGVIDEAVWLQVVAKEGEVWGTRLCKGGEKFGKEH